MLGEGGREGERLVGKDRVGGKDGGEERIGERERETETCDM